LATVVAAAQGPARTQAPQRKPLRQPDIFFVPTLESVADQMLQLAGVTRADVVYDLGSGDGRILMLAAQKYGARCVGIELDPRLVDLSRGVAREAKEDRVSFIEGDLFEADISEATVVTIYLSTTVNARLEPKLRQELRPGARVVSHQFPVGRWVPDRTARADDGTLLYLWRIPPR
jgi:SAM-dependent methyltransferase